MATSNPYVGGAACNFVNPLGISPLNFLKFPVFFHANRISVMQGRKHSARKDSSHRYLAVVFNRCFSMPSVFLLTTRCQTQRHHGTPQNASTALDASF